MVSGTIVRNAIIIPYSKAAMAQVPKLEAVSSADVLKRSIVHAPILKNPAAIKDVNQRFRPPINERYGKLIVVSSPLDSN